MPVFIDWNSDPELGVIALLPGRENPVQCRLHNLPPEGVVASFRLNQLLPHLKGVEKSRLLDAELLARIVLPTQESYELSSLALKFGIPAEVSKAAERVALAAAVYEKLLQELQSKPLGLLDEMRRLLEPTEHPLKLIVEDAARTALRQGFAAEKKDFMDLLPADSPVGRVSRKAPKEPPDQLDIEKIGRIFSKEGALAKTFGAYECRPEQIRMVREVCESLNQGLVALIEAGTGTGKSLAYLVPAIAWSVKNGDPVIISTNTKNLQSQLFQKDLPFLEKALGRVFKYALIKGRSNYLCIRRLLFLLRAADRELTEADRLELLPILSWLPQTKTGDVAEIAGFRGGMQSDLWEKISTKRGECLGTECRFARKCFVRKARAEAMRADIVVANHSTVFWETGEKSVALPPFRCIVFDEAHNLESVATDCAAIQVASWQIAHVLNRLFRPLRDGAGRGLFSSMRRILSLASGSLPEQVRKRLSTSIEEAIALFPSIRNASDSFFERLSYLFVRTPHEAIRYDAERPPDDWPQIAGAGVKLQETISDLVALLDGLQVGCSEESEMHDGQAPFDDLKEIASEVGAQAAFLREISDNLKKTVAAEDEAFVFWVQRGRGNIQASLNAAPLDIASLMETTIFSRMRTAIFTSATLTVGGNFNFMKDRLGMRGAVSSRLHEADLGTSFDFQRQSLLLVPSFLPEPQVHERDFVAPFAELAIKVLTETRGRGLVLFTSHSMLRAASGPIAENLSRQGITVLTQGIDGERARLVSQFSNTKACVLLGTQSFWEGVDVPGESLSCLIVAKLPFRVHTDPIVSARCDLLKRRGANDFTEYLVPDAAIRLKQGFGRLIRTRTDRGVAIICDYRMITKNYGSAFRNSLPTKPHVFREPEGLVAAVRDFLK